MGQYTFYAIYIAFTRVLTRSRPYNTTAVFIQYDLLRTRCTLTLAVCMIAIVTLPMEAIHTHSLEKSNRRTFSHSGELDIIVIQSKCELHL